MGNKITVITQPKNRISINTSQRTQIKTVNVVGATTAGTGTAATRLRDLTDVDATHLVNNETIVYDEVSGKFVVEEIPIINGGTF